MRVLPIRESSWWVAIGETHLGKTRSEMLWQRLWGSPPQSAESFKEELRVRDSRMVTEDDFFSSDSEYWSGEDDSQDEEPLQEGAIYTSASAIVHAVQDIALKQGKSVVVIGHGGADRRIVCRTDDCPFTVRAYRRSKIVNGKREW